MGQTFEKRSSNGQKYKILKISNYEERSNEDTEWLTLLCQREDIRRFRPNVRRAARRDNEDELPSTERVNFWDLDLSRD